MRKKTILALNQVNLDFYKVSVKYLNHSDSVYRLGWDDLIEPIKRINSPISLLDIGCGDGRFGLFLIRNGVDLNTYVGLDNSLQNLEIATDKLSKLKFDKFELIQTDFLEDPDWDKAFTKQANLVVLLGLIHHIPSRLERLGFIKKVSNCLKPGDTLIWSVFQYLDIPRLRRQVLDCEKKEVQSYFQTRFDLDLSDIEDGDNILEWKKTLPTNEIVKTYRYSHYFSQLEIHDLIQAGNLKLIHDFTENGKEGGTNRYFICTKN